MVSLWHQDYFGIMGSLFLGEMLEAQKVRSVLGPRAWAFRTLGALLLQNAQSHSQTIFFENKLDNIIK